MITDMMIVVGVVGVVFVYLCLQKRRIRGFFGILCEWSFVVSANDPGSYRNRDIRLRNIFGDSKATEALRNGFVR